MSTLRVNNLQIGQSGTAAQNFTLYQPTTPDGTLRLAVGNSGATTGDVLSVSNTGLSVTGTLSATGNVTLSGGTANGVLYLNGSKVATTGSALTFNGTTFQYTGAANFATSSGNVGIGTSSPQDILDINSLSGTAAIRIATQGVGSLTWRIASQLVGVANAGFAIRDETNAVNRLVIDGSGNVGIGTSSPAYKLDVFGNQRIYLNNTSVGNASSMQLTQVGTGDAAISFLIGTSTEWLVGADNSDSDNFKISNITGGGDFTSAGLTLTTSGNLGLGVTPSAWASGMKVLQFANGATVGSLSATYALFAQNYYYDGTNNIYLTTNRASLYAQTGGQHQWFIAPSGTAGNAITFTQAMTLDADGDLVIGGTSAPSRVTVVQGTTPTDYSTVAVMVGGNGADSYAVGASHNIGFLYDPTNSAIPAVAIGHVITSDSSFTKGALTFATRDVTTNTAPTERARITSGGELLVGVTTSTANGGITLRPSAANPYVYVGGSSSSSSDVGYYVYSSGAGAYRFYVTYAGGIYATSTSITAISDASLKENIRDLETGLPEVMALKPRRFDWKNGDAQNVAGFVAQEVEQILPELVTDYVYNKDVDGNDIIKKSLKMGDILPTLVKAIQEQQALITALTARVATLEGTQP